MQKVSTKMIRMQSMETVSSEMRKAQLYVDIQGEASTQDSQPSEHLWQTNILSYARLRCGVKSELVDEWLISYLLFINFGCLHLAPILRCWMRAVMRSNEEKRKKTSFEIHRNMLSV
jgi:hypothetical protein